MLRLITCGLIALTLSGCNFGDEVTFPGNSNTTSNQTTNSNNSTTDMGATTADDGTAAELSVELSNVTVNGEALPTQVSAGTTYGVSATMVATNSSDCEGCNLQVVVGVTDSSEPACLFDGIPASNGQTVSVDLEAPLTAGSGELTWAAYEAADCAAAIARAMADMPATSLGTITFGEAPALSVIAVTPAADAIDIPIDSEIRISFDAPIDATSVTGHVFLNDGAAQVPISVSVAGSEIIIIPQGSLAEFQTDYTIEVSSGIASGARNLANDFASGFQTQMFVPGALYALSNEFHGATYSLGIDGGSQCVMVPSNDQSAAQRFRFAPLDDGWIIPNAMPPTAALDSGDGTTKCAMRSYDIANPAQKWFFVKQPSRGFLLMSDSLGATLSLDATDLPPAPATAPRCDPNGGNACPLMAPTDAASPQQLWHLRRVN